ncbi:MAG: hypothetical protein ABI589_08875 [Burkholderiales bacterium]
MRSAPSVSFPVGRSRFAGALALLLWCCGMLLALRALAAASSIGWREAAMLAAALAAGAIALGEWLRSPQGRLSFDGQGWHWIDARAGRLGRIAVMLDLQQRMLVRFVGAGDGRGALWLWLDQSAAPERWHEFRSAAHARTVRASVGV